MTRVIMIHGNGGSTAEGGWFPTVATELRLHGLDVTNETFPDNEAARASIWLPHLESLGAGDDTILIGHSSGAVAALRYAESHTLVGTVIVGASYTDLGDADEAASGYFTSPWNWTQIKSNQAWIIQFASTDDPYIPYAEPSYIHDQLHTELQSFTDRGHFMDMDSFPELVPAVLSKLQ
jgi:predicted alpha/beta hydrolase family esterase